jgi:C-terminal region of Mon2 protein
LILCSEEVIIMQIVLSAPPPSRGLEEIETDEAVDCQVIEQLRDEVLPHAHTIPKEFILKVVVLLNKGSIHSATHTSSTGWFLT